MPSEPDPGGISARRSGGRAYHDRSAFQVPGLQPLVGAERLVKAETWSPRPGPARGRPGRAPRTAPGACGKGPADSRDVIVIIPSATANEPAPELAADDLSMLETAGATSTEADAYVVDPATGQPTEVPLPPRRADGQVEYGPRRSDLLAQNVGRVERILQLIASAVRATSPPGMLLILSSGLSTAGGFDLRQVGWDASPATVAAQLKARGLLSVLAGWQVVFSGLGDTAGTQPPLPLPQRTTLTSYWMAICHAAGAPSCHADEMTRPDPPSHSKTAVPVVPVPRVQSVRGPHGSTSISIPNDELFGFGGASLLAGADSILGPLAAKARSGHLTATITGYASPDGGSPAYNLALSRARALTVRARLVTGHSRRSFQRVGGWIG